MLGQIFETLCWIKKGFYTSQFSCIFSCMIQMLQLRKSTHTYRNEDWCVRIHLCGESLAVCISVHWEDALSLRSWLTLTYLFWQLIIQKIESPQRPEALKHKEQLRNRNTHVMNVTTIYRCMASCFNI